ncbi:MAG: cytochrome P450 [Alphaproteobacteria bacterium]
MTYKFDPLTPEFAANPYPTYAALRQLDKPVYFAAVDMWMLSRYDDIAQITQDPKMVRSLVGHCDEAELKQRQIQANWHDMPYHERVVQSSLLDSDGPTHKRLRKLVLNTFTRNSITELKPYVESLIKRLLEKQHDNVSFDFVEQVAEEVPGHVIGRLLGVPEADVPQLREWSHTIVGYFDVDRTMEKKQKAETATKEFYQYLQDMREERRKKPKDDLVSRMIAADQGGIYSDDEFVSVCMLLLMAGHGSTTDVLGTGLHTLIQHPDSMNVLRNHPSKMQNALQEMFRFEPPLPFFHRHTLRDVEIRGHSFEAGTTFGILYASANRDSSQFVDPDKFEIDRFPNRHLAFGQGAHFCLGNFLARQNMEIIFSELLNNYKSIELVDDLVPYKSGLSVRGPESMNIQLVKH